MAHSLVWEEKAHPLLAQIAAQLPARKITGVLSEGQTAKDLQHNSDEVEQKAPA